MSLHSNWEGFLKLNLLSIPVKAYSADVSRSHVSFHQSIAAAAVEFVIRKSVPFMGK